MIARSGSMATAFGFPAAMALVPQTVPEEIRKQANAINRLIANAAMIGGAVGGGIIVAAVGPGWALLVNAVMFAVAAVTFAFVRVAAYRPDTTAHASLLTDLREGWAEFTRRTWVWAVVLAFMFFNMAVFGAVQVLGPAIADQTIGRSLWGVVLAAETAGMVAGAVVAMALRARRLLLLGVVCSGGSLFFMLGLALAPRAAVLIPAAFATGMVVEQFNIAWDTSLQDNIPPDKLARVYSYDSLGSFIAIPIGQVAVGPIAVAIGATRTMLIAAAVVAVAVIGMLLVRGIRKLEHPPRADSSPTPSAEAVPPALPTEPMAPSEAA